MLARLAGAEIWLSPTAGWPSERRAWQRNNGFSQCFCPRESCPNSCLFSLPLEISQFSSFPYIHDTFITSAPCGSSEQVSLWANEFVCGPFRLSVSCSLFFFSDIIPSGFHSQMSWPFSSRHRSPGWGVWYGAMVLQCSEESSTVRYFFWFSIATCGCGTKLFCVSAPPKSLDVGSLYP